MRFTLTAAIAAASLSSGVVAFAPSISSKWGVSRVNTLQSTVEADNTVTSSAEVAAPVAQSVEEDTFVIESTPRVNQGSIVPLTGAEINARLNAQLEKLRQKDSNSIRLSKEDLKIVYEDEYIVVVDKPSGVLTVAGKQDNPSLAQAVFEAVDSDLASGDHMIVHRLGMDTSGLVVLAKNLEAVRGMNTVFRSRKIERQYEALVVGRMENEEGLISLPIMRDYEFPPYVRISTYEHQEALLGLLPEEVGAKLLEAPKESITKYQVLSREEYGGQPVTRVALTSISGRYHQLNVHMAAFGHPIVGDTVYGINGDAAANGGLNDAELETLAPNANRASLEVQKAVAAAASNLSPCVHAKSLKFRHPVTKEDVELSTNAPF